MNIYANYCIFASWIFLFLVDPLVHARQSRGNQFAFNFGHGCFQRNLQGNPYVPSQFTKIIYTPRSQKFPCLRGNEQSITSPSHLFLAKGDSKSHLTISLTTKEKRTRKKQHATKKRNKTKATKLESIAKTSTKKTKRKSTSKDHSRRTKKKQTSARDETLQQNISTIKKRSMQTKEQQIDYSSNVFIQFSRVFQRHVVYRCQESPDEKENMTVVQSFQFLDDSMKKFPNACILAPKDFPFPSPTCSLDVPDNSVDKKNVEDELCEYTVAGMGLWSLCDVEYKTSNESRRRDFDESYAALRTLLQLVSPPTGSSLSFNIPRHFFRLEPHRFALRGHTPESITTNYHKIVNLLSCGRIGNAVDVGEKHQVGLAMDQSDVSFVMSNFPQLCLYDWHEVETLIRFLVSPVPDSLSLAEIDWAKMLSQGYGAGLTIRQATQTLRMMPEFMALYHEDSRKPSIVYLYNQMQTPMLSKLCDEVNLQLNEYLEGTDPSDAYAFAFLHSIGISWDQIRILVSALPLWITNNLEPGWDLLQRGPVRTMLKRPSLDYLRQRLQVGPSQIYHLLKTHTRLSGYDSCSKIRPVLDALQSRLELSCVELRKIILRMPSLLGMKESSFEARIDFFQREAGMSVLNIKKSVLKQPSLLQYSVDSSLRPKLQFFVDELKIPPEFVGKIIESAPALMGLSLSKNLRPKAKSIIMMCSMTSREVGSIVATSPQVFLLSQKNIESTLEFISSELALTYSRELGEMLLSAPRILLQSLDSSLSMKINRLRYVFKSKKTANEVFKANPRLLVLTKKVLEDRIQRCIEANRDLEEYFMPSEKGRKKLVRLPTTSDIENTVFISTDVDFNSISGIFPDHRSAARHLGISEREILDACKEKISIQGSYVCALGESRTPIKRQALLPARQVARMRNITFSIFVSGSVYPRDNFDSARGRSKSGGLALSISADRRDVETRQILEELHAAARSSFGIHVPLTVDDDEKRILAVFPFVNPSRNRCELFACYGALRVIESFVNQRLDDTQHVLDFKVFTDSNYAWKLVRNKDRLNQLGLAVSSQEMLAELDESTSFPNIDIFHPLARIFCRLNKAKPDKSSSHSNDHCVRIEFAHDIDNALINGGKLIARDLNRHARIAAMWQYNRERNLT